jgi:AraC-like DNA-binding protein
MTGTATRAAPVELLRHLRRARDHIDGHFVTALELDQLARVAGVSKFHFVRSFKATYGETPIRYLTRRRVERAQDLLRAANLTVTEVCLLVGFASLGSFSARFTQVVGESPTAYRNRWAARGGPHVPGCYLFMRGVLDPSGTTGPLAGKGNRAI